MGVRVERRTVPLLCCRLVVFGYLVVERERWLVLVGETGVVRARVVKKVVGKRSKRHILKFRKGWECRVECKTCCCVF